MQKLKDFWPKKPPKSQKAVVELADVARANLAAARARARVVVAADRRSANALFSRRTRYETLLTCL